MRAHAPGKVTWFMDHPHVQSRAVFAWSMRCSVLRAWDKWRSLIELVTLTLTLTLTLTPTLSLTLTPTFSLTRTRTLTLTPTLTLTLTLTPSLTLSLA